MVATSSVCRSWRENGYFVVRAALPPDRIAALREAVEDIFTAYLEFDPDRCEPGDPDVNSVRHLHRPEYHSNYGKHLQTILDVAADPTIVSIVEDAFQEPIVFHDTSLWIDPFFTFRAGHWHRDHQYVVANEEAERALMDHPTFPHCGMQLQVPMVLSQELQYVLGSHRRWDTPEEYNIRKLDDCRNRYSDDMPGFVSIQSAPGDIQAINPAGIHRGRYTPDRLRRTLQITYTTQRHVGDYSSAQPWLYDAGYLDRITGYTRETMEQWINVLMRYRESALGSGAARPFWYA